MISLFILVIVVLLNKYTKEENEIPSFTSKKLDKILRNKDDTEKLYSSILNKNSCATDIHFKNQGSQDVKISYDK